MKLMDHTTSTSRSSRKSCLRAAPGSSASAKVFSESIGSNEAPSQPGYKGTICSRIQKGDFMQFGKIFSLPSDYPTLNDEHFIYNHEIPGMVGFVGYDLPLT